MASYLGTRETLLGLDGETADPEASLGQESQTWRVDVTLRDGPIDDAEIAREWIRTSRMHREQM